MFLNNLFLRTSFLAILSFVVLSYLNSNAIVEKLKSDAIFLNIEDVNVAYKEFGKENQAIGTIVFLHGFSGSSSDWEFIVKHLSKKYHCITIDIPPFGLSEKSRTFDYSDQNIVRTLISALDKIGVNKFILVGHSMGGYLSILIANEIPERIEKLILIDSAYNIPAEHNTTSNPQSSSNFSNLEDLSNLLNVGLKIYPLVKLVYYSSLGESVVLSKDHFEKLFSQNFFLPGDVLVKFTVDKSAQSNKTENIDFSKFIFPTLIVYGENDTVTPPKIGKFLHSMLPNSEFILIPNEGHMPLFNEITIGKIKKFLQNTSE